MEFGGDGNVLHHDFSDSSIILYIYQSSLNCTLKNGKFIVFKLHLNQNKKKTQ